MGITGTDVSKEAADMVLSDDNFASIVAAVEEGRGIYGNIRKFVSFLLSCNAGEIVVMLLATLLFTDPELLPFLLPIQLLWINLVTDGLPAIALGLEPASPDVMTECPRDPKEPPVTRKMAVRIAIIGTLMGIVTLISFVIAQGSGGSVDESRTAAFCTIVLAQLLYVFSARDFDKPLLELGRYDRLLLAAGAALLLQLAVVYIPVVNNVFHTAPLGGEWLFIVPLAFVPLLFNEGWKYIRRLRGGKAEVCEIDYD